jgi:hypothetical protein
VREARPFRARLDDHVEQHLFHALYTFFICI